MRLPRIRRCLTSGLILLWMSLVIYLLLGVLLSNQWSGPVLMRHYQSNDPEYNLRHNPRLDKLTVDLLKDLGFVSHPKLYPQSYHGERSNLPVFITAVSAEELQLSANFIYSVLKYFPDKRLVIYSLDLTEEQKVQIRYDCRCQVRSVNWEIYPLHVKNLQLKAFRPLLIQEALQEFGAVFWAEPETRFHSAELNPVQTQAESTGIVAWPLTHPTSTLTHYNMFRYFNASHQDYFFHRMVEPDRVMMYNTPHIHEKLMLPWVHCALDVDCIAPPGAQPHGCDFTHRPRYIYAGCHKYDMSAFNVVLGKVFKLETPYIAVMDLFVVVPTPRKKITWTSLWNLTSLRFGASS